MYDFVVTNETEKIHASHPKGIGWGSTRFTYTKELVDDIRKLLEVNGQDIVKVFSILESPGKDAQGLLRLIQRIQQGKE